MVVSRAATTSKRKKTTDMPDSPPKRITRARAKAAGDVESQLKLSDVVSASAKASVKNKRPPLPSKATAPTKETAPAKATKRKTRADEENPDPDAEVVIAEDTQTSVSKKRTRQRKLLDEVKEDALKIAVPTVSNAEAKVGIEAPKPRGRAKKVTSTKPTESVDTKDSEGIEPLKNLRARPTAVVAKRSTASSTATKPATRKKVNFQLQNELDKDKENVPLPAKVPERGALKATGLKAKPIRKPASSKAGNRGKKAAKLTRGEELRPLSPKKATQVAKSSPVCSEDELGGDKTPVRPLSRSPIKPPMSMVREVGKLVSKIDIGSMEAPPDLESVISSSALASPARRPPPSPFKDALKESPKRVKLVESSLNPGFQAPNSTAKSSLLQSPARRLAISIAPHSAMKAPQSMMKASLLQTPARRPAITPIRFPPLSAPPKPDFLMSIRDVPVSANQRLSPRNLQLSTLRPPPVPLDESTNAEEFKEAGQEEEAGSEISDTPVTLNLIQESNPEDSHTSAENVCDSMDFAFDAHSVLNISPSPAHRMERIPVDSELQSMKHEQKPGPGAHIFALQAPIFTAKAFSLTPLSPMYDEQSESEDELTAGHDLYAPTPFGYREISKYQDSFTPLATKLSGWRASSPEKKTSAERSERNRALISPAGPTIFDKPEQGEIAVPVDSPKFSFFEDEIAVRDEEGNESLIAEPIIREVCVEAGASQESQTSEEYGDENALPLDPQLPNSEPAVDQPNLACTPQNVFSSRSREIHTVSKVPLRSSADDSPLDIPRKRSRSLAGPLTDIYTSQNDEYGGNNMFLPVVQDTSVLSEVRSGRPTFLESFVSEMPHTPGSSIFSNSMSPLRNLRKGSPDVLKGAVVYVDVHTTEGADASGIFLDLLTQMGARCVKQWLWNSRSGAVSSGDSVAIPSPECATPSSKIGITHVVYKDGGRRTLEKVREANGVVLCVGVGWVLDCEREDRWLEEAPYAVDTSLIPRGGHNRRKSMEPRALLNLNGNLIPAETPAKTPMLPIKQTATAATAAELGFIPFDTPASRRDTFVIETPRAPITTPSLPINKYNADNVEEWTSPTTPYYLSRGAQLVQQTCPPKQTGQLLFPVSGNIADHPDEAIRQRLIAARRKSLQWQPKISSPLGRAVSYGK